MQTYEFSTNKKIYIVGDIFQDIFGNKIKKVTDVDFTLKESYRTHPKTLMFSQALGLGLMEDKDKFIDCLKPEEWESCGYRISYLEGNKYNLQRENLAIFSDEIKIERPFEVDKIKKIEILKDTLDNIKFQFPDLKLGDIAIVVLFKNAKSTYKIIDTIRELLYEINLDFTVAYESREYKEDKIFITNQNNVKGLEFPFVICISDKINFEQLTTAEIKFRNALYMTLSRSFLKTYWFTIEDDNYLNNIENKSKTITNSLELDIIIPKNCDEIKTRVLKVSELKESLSFRDYLNEIYKELNLTSEQRKIANNLILKVPKFSSEDFQKLRDKNEIIEFIKTYVLI